MVGFRNVPLHEYRRLDINLMVDVIEHRLGDMLSFADSMVEEFLKNPG